jgi:hypothetical protein
MKREKEKEKERYYLFAGMGGRPQRQKHRIFLVWSIAAGLLVSISLAATLYFVNLRH